MLTQWYHRVSKGLQNLIQIGQLAGSVSSHLGLACNLVFIFHKPIGHGGRIGKLVFPCGRSRVHLQLSQANDLANVYLSLPSLLLGIVHVVATCVIDHTRTSVLLYKFDSGATISRLELMLTWQKLLRSSNP